MKVQKFVLALTLAGAPLVVGAQTPVPRPFPGAPAPPAPATSAPATPQAPAEPPPAPSPEPAPVVPEVPGMPSMYPNAEFLETVDAGSGQQYHLYGANASFAEVVAFYRTVLKNGGREIYRTPGIHQFDLGRFNEARMAYPPSVVVKDYTTGTPSGYLHVAGTEEKRFRTVIQVVPPSPQ